LCSELFVLRQVVGRAFALCSASPIQKQDGRAADINIVGVAATFTRLKATEG